MKKKRIWLVLTAVFLAILLTGELIWVGIGLNREEPESELSTQTAEIIPEMRDASDIKDDADSEGDSDPNSQDDQDQDQPQDADLVSSDYMEAQSVTDLKDTAAAAAEKKSEENGSDSSDSEGTGDSDKKGDGSGSGEGEQGDGDEKDKKKDKTDDDPEPVPGPEDDSDLDIITDLVDDGTVTADQLSDGVLSFYAYIQNGTNDMQLEVRLFNSTTSKNGKVLTADGRNYQALLQQNTTGKDRNRFELYVTQKGKTLLQETYYVSYVTKKADKDQPDVGEGVTITTPDLVQWAWNDTSNQNFTFRVKAKANSTGKNLSSSDLTVWLDGTKLVNEPTGGPTYEYETYFTPPKTGDTSDHTISVLAVDPSNTANSSYVECYIHFNAASEGDVIGHAYICLDMTTVGLGLWDEPQEVEIKQGQPASYNVQEFLENNGFEVTHGGTLDVGYYVARLGMGGFFSAIDIPENLWKLIEKDGLTQTGPSDGSSLGEHDYTQGSGWMYSVGGEVYAGKGLSSYYLSDGETLYIRYTLAYGKDIGGESSTGGEYGTLSTYCGKWINGQEILNHQWGEVKVTKEATCTDPGEQCAVCAICGLEQDKQEIPALGHDYQESSRTEPTTDTPGQIVYKCTRCGDEKTEEIPVITPEPTPEPVDPTPEPDSSESTEMS